MKPCHANQAGFTLMETLVAVSVTGLVSILVLSGLGFEGRAWRHASLGAERTSEVYAAQQVIRQLVRNAAPRSENALFVGAPGQLGFITRFAFPGAAPQKTLARLFLIPCTEDQCLMLSLTVLDSESRPAGPPIEEPLLRGIAGLSFDYFGGTDDPRWQAEWPEERGRPGLVRMRVRFEEGDRRRWPTLIAGPQS